MESLTWKPIYWWCALESEVIAPKVELSVEKGVEWAQRSFVKYVGVLEE